MELSVFVPSEIEPLAAAKASVGWIPAPTPVRLAAEAAVSTIVDAPFVVTAETSKEVRPFATAVQSESAYATVTISENTNATRSTAPSALLSW